MRAFSVTDTGIKRETNQDYIYCNSEREGVFDNLFIVADGMGGHNAGDFASRCAVEEFVNYIDNGEEKTIIGRFEAGIARVNRIICEKSQENEVLSGMGTTFVAATINDGNLYAANIGDSRLYLITEGRMEQITQDHSLVEEMVKNGQIKREESRLHPKKNVITRAIGVGAEVTPDFFEVSLKEKDMILMCSDGLSNMLDDSEICNIVINSADNPENAVAELVAKANENGGPDNISVILVQY